MNEKTRKEFDKIIKSSPEIQVKLDDKTKKLFTDSIEKLKKYYLNDINEIRKLREPGNVDINKAIDFEQKAAINVLPAEKAVRLNELYSNLALLNSIMLCSKICPLSFKLSKAKEKIGSAMIKSEVEAYNCLLLINFIHTRFQNYYGMKIGDNKTRDEMDSKDKIDIDRFVKNNPNASKYIKCIISKKNNRHFVINIGKIFVNIRHDCCQMCDIPIIMEKKDLHEIDRPFKNEEMYEEKDLSKILGMS